MNLSKNKKTAGFILGVFAVVGIYNAVVINSDSNILGSNHNFKRLDEVYGVKTPGRKIASNKNWKKLENNKVESNLVAVKAVKEDVSNEQSVAAIQNNLNLSLTEVGSFKKYKNGLAQDEFEGQIVTSNGMIENLQVELSKGDILSISNVEMKGNVFEYTQDGEVRSGLFFQVEKNKFMVTLTNGPFEGARLTFSKGEKVSTKIQTKVADTEISIGSFGSKAEPKAMIEDGNIEVSAQSQGVNFNNGVI